MEDVLEAYSHIVPLGTRCATTHNVRRYFNFGEGYPFDWWITPFEGLLSVLERPDIDWLYDPDLLRLTDGRKSVAHAPTQILFHHEFAREPGPGIPVRTDFLEHLEIPRARTGKLLAKLLALDAPGNRILFIREDGAPEPLMPALSARFSRADWSLQVIPEKIVYGADFKTENPGMDWQGDPAAWDEVLGKLDVRLDNPSLKPFAFVSPTHESTKRPASRG